MNNYKLAATTEEANEAGGIALAAKKLWPLLIDEKRQLLYAAIAIVINSTLTLVGPVLVGHAIDDYIQVKQFDGVLMYVAILLGIYTLALFSSYAQTRLMGGVGQRVLFRLRNAIFEKLQDLPIAFFQQNKAGDLISRINNDTDKLGQFFSQSLMQFVGSIFIIIGSGIAILLINWKLGLAALIPAALLFIMTKALGPWIKRKNRVNMDSVGDMSAEIQESLDHFKVVVAFNRRDYFRAKFDGANQHNYTTALRAGIANNTFTPVYGFASNAAIVIVITYGIYLITHGQFTLGLLISFLTYINRLYDPLRQIASLWTTFQVALAGWDRIHAILLLETDLVQLPATDMAAESAALIEFHNVSFAYPGGASVLSDVSFTLQPGHTYALVGPTGGGKTTTASLMARLFDPTAGTVLYQGQDLRTLTPEQRAAEIGFILQEPFLFSGTIADNLRYGNPDLQERTTEQLQALLADKKLDHMFEKFEQGLDTPVSALGDAMSLGQKQIIAFVRTILREPKLLILDEATANIDTVTEQLLETILKALPPTTTRVIIAHRLNTIAEADTIFFVNGNHITEAGSMQEAVDLLMHGRRES